MTGPTGRSVDLDFSHLDDRGVDMGLRWNSGRSGRESQHGSTRAHGKARGRRTWGMPEALEGRCLLAVTSTTPVPFAAIEQTAHTGSLMTFTASDAGPFTADIVWGDTTSDVGVPVVGGVVTGTHTYAEDGTYSVAVTI